MCECILARKLSFLYATKWQYNSAQWQRLGLINNEKRHTPCKGIIILPLQGVYFDYLHKTQGVAIGLSYNWLSAKKNSKLMGRQSAYTNSKYLLWFKKKNINILYDTIFFSRNNPSYTVRTDLH